eukprot:s42_g12.t1
MMLPVCFHVTHKDNLWDIWKYGLIPGGKSNSRIFTFFNPYAPWDHRSWGITKSVDTRQGQVVTNKDIPFSKIRGAWVQDYQQRWIRLIVPSGEEQVVRDDETGRRKANRRNNKKSGEMLGAQGGAWVGLQGQPNWMESPKGQVKVESSASSQQPFF